MKLRGFLAGWQCAGQDATYYCSNSNNGHRSMRGPAIEISLTAQGTLKPHCEHCRFTLVCRRGESQ
jgi:hypothetical protein